MPYSVQIQLDKLISAIRQILSISKQILFYFVLGQKKYEYFLKFKLASILLDWKILIHILLEVSQTTQDQIQIRTQDKCQRRHYIKQIIKVIFTNIRYMIDFIELNQETFYFLRKDLTKYLMPRMKTIKRDKFKRNINNDSCINLKNDPFSINNRNLKSQIIPESHSYRQNFNDFRSPNRHVIDDDGLDSIEENFDYQSQFQQPDTQNNLARLFYVMNNDRFSNCPYKKLFYSLQNSLKNLYSSLVYHNEEKTHKLQAYSTISKKVQSHKNHFLMGLYIGLGSVTLVALLILLIFDLVQFDYDDTRVDSMNYVFPMFRGIGLLILYFWGMAWNVYGFTKFRINHRLVLQYGSHYSTHFQLMKRAGFFTLVFSFMLLIYCIIQSLTTKQYLDQNNNLIEYTPFVVYVLYFSYIFFPNRDVFNPKGRRYFYDLLKKIIFSPVLKITFLITWASDQAVSFVIPFKDFAYTICFYTSKIDLQSAKDCLNPANKQGILVVYVVAILPLLLRMIQCYRQAIQASGKFIGHIQFWNFLKYFSSVITATVSYITTLYPDLFPYFILSSIISTSYSYYWDLKNDWGLLQKNCKNKFLRTHLCYKNQNYYYLAITTNLALRCAWTLTISPSVVTYLHKSTFLPFLTGSLEIFRRCMWNFIRIQKQHLINCQDYIIMRPQVQKIAQKLKKRQRQTKIQTSFEPIDDHFLGGIHKVKKSFIDKIHQQLNLPQFLGREQYQAQWAELNKTKVGLKKKDFLNQREKQKNVFTKTKYILEQKYQQFQQSIY